MFNLAEYEHFECVEHGDLNWIVCPLHGTREGICAFAGEFHSNVSQYWSRRKSIHEYTPQWINIISGAIHVS